jgi:hypothetical protein
MKRLDFSQALSMLKARQPVARAGWNGKGMFVYLVGPGNYPPATDVAKAAFNGGLVPYRPYLAMKTAQGDVVPWVASQSDLLADDWFIAVL